MQATRKNYLALLYSAGNPFQAQKLEPSCTLDEYYQMLDTQEYQDFAKKHLSDFCTYAEGLLLYRLDSLSEILKSLPPEHKNYPSIHAQYLKTLELTSPIITKLATVARENNILEGFKLVIL